MNSPIQRGLVQELRENRLQYTTSIRCRFGARMEVVIAIELIAGTVFVVNFWYTNPDLVLSRRFSRLDAYDDEEDEDASGR